MNEINENGYTGQLQGSFEANEDLLVKIKSQCKEPFKGILKLGITSQEGHFININGEKFRIGKTGKFEFRNVDINELKFLQEEDSHSFIDYIYIGGE